MSEQKPTGEWTCGGDDMQPKPTTGKWTPWHVQAICEKGYADDLTPETAQVIADAHNAELAAERDKATQDERNRWQSFEHDARRAMEERAQLRSQLAEARAAMKEALFEVEVEDRDAAMKVLNEAINTSITAESKAHNDTLTAAKDQTRFYEEAKRQYQQQLAAEREKVRNIGEQLDSYVLTVERAEREILRLRKQLAAEQEETDLWKRQAAFESKHREKYRGKVQTLVELLKTAIRCGRGLGSEWRDKAKVATQDYTDHNPLKLPASYRESAKVKEGK